MLGEKAFQNDTNSIVNSCIYQPEQQAYESAATSFLMHGMGKLVFVNTGQDLHCLRYNGMIGNVFRLRHWNKKTKSDQGHLPRACMDCHCPQ